MAQRSVIGLLTSAQADSLDWLLAPLCGSRPPALDADDVFAAGWRSTAMRGFAVTMASMLAGTCRVRRLGLCEERSASCLLTDKRDREWELLATFEAAGSGRIASFCLRPVLATSVGVRPPAPSDIPAMTALERSAPVHREDGTEVVIDHNGRQFDPIQVVSDHRWLAAFQENRMVAIQAAALVTAPIGGVSCRIAYNHYSRSDPKTRQSGNLIHLVSTLYKDIYPGIDQFLSLVDIQNTAGLRLSFGSPWPGRVHRLFLPVASLAATHGPAPAARRFDAERAAALLNAIHDGMNLWVPRTAAFLLERQKRAPSVYGAGCWRMTANAALAVWPSGERRIYRREGKETVRTLALVLDYGFRGDAGRSELIALLAAAARELAARGITHLALFVPASHQPTRFLADLAEAYDVYAVCAPPLERPAPPDGPVYIDHILF